MSATNVSMFANTNVPIAEQAQIPEQSPDYAGYLTQLSSVFGSLANSSNNLKSQPWENVRYNRESDTYSVLSGTAQGAAVGAQYGGWIGAIVGGVIGGGVSAFSASSKREAQLRAIRIAQDAKARQIINAATHERKKLRRTTSQFKKVIQSGVLGEQSAKIAHTAGAKHGYLAAQGEQVSDKLSMENIKQDRIYGEDVIDGQAVAAMQKIAILEMADRQLIDAEINIWEGRRSGTFDTSTFAKLDTLIESL